MGAGIGLLLLLPGQDASSSTVSQPGRPAGPEVSDAPIPGPSGSAPAAAPLPPAAAVPSAQPAQPLPPDPPVPDAAPPAPSRPPVTVLNNSRRNGLADRAASRFRGDGWPVGEVGNYDADVLERSTVFYASGQQAAAERFAREFDVPRVQPRDRGQPDGLTVVLTRDFPGG